MLDKQVSKTKPTTKVALPNSFCVPSETDVEVLSTHKKAFHVLFHLCWKLDGQNQLEGLLDDTGKRLWKDMKKQYNSNERLFDKHLKGKKTENLSKLSDIEKAVLLPLFRNALDTEHTIFLTKLT